MREIEDLDHLDDDLEKRRILSEALYRDKILRYFIYMYIHVFVLDIYTIYIYMYYV